MEAQHPGVYTESIASTVPEITRAPTSITAFVGSFPAGPIGVPHEVRSTIEFEKQFAEPGVFTEASVAVHDFFNNGGTHAVIVAASTGTTRSTTNELLRALNTLATATSDTPMAQVVCIPDMARRVEPLDEPQYAELLLRATGFCVQNRMFFIVDPNTTGEQASDIATWLNNNASWGSANSALYFPRLHTAAGRVAGGALVPASGSVAGAIARTDATRGVWKAPAGRELVLHATVAKSMSDTEQSPLNRQSVNVIRHFDDTGTLIWGSRTGAGTVASEYRHVSVRRTALFLDHSLHQGLQWAVFEANDEPLWAMIRTSVTNFMTELWRAGAFSGDTADEAFTVRCGDETISRADKRRGRTIVEVGFAALRPANFVMVRIVINRR